MKIKLLISMLFILTFLSKANAQYTKIFDFDGAVSGSSPNGSLVFDGTFLYGMTSGGGAGCSGSCGGTIFKIKPDGTAYTTLLNFNGVNGSTPYGSLISDGTYLYGMTEYGGIYAEGTIFKIKTDGTGYYKLYDFSHAYGVNPYGSLISDGTFLYGMTLSGGGIDSVGSIFKIKTDGTAFTNLHNFSRINGGFPFGSLISDGTYLYGMTSTCDTSTSAGTIFKIKTDGTGYSNLMSFNGVNGSTPNGSLISDGTYLYGMTEYGGIHAEGNIFKIKMDGTGFYNLFDFDFVTTGKTPRGDLLFDGTFLYGMTPTSGPNYNGTIFKIKSDGTGLFADIYDFNAYPDGSSPLGSLISDGINFYGMTTFGGTGDVGTIFKLGSATSIIENHPETDLTIYPNPATNDLTLQFDASTPLSMTSIEVKNVLGQTMYSETLKNVIGKQSKNIDVSFFSNGVYFVQLFNGSSVTGRKFIKQ